MTIDPSRADALRRTFDEDGSLVVRGVLDADLVAEMSAHVDWLQARHPELRGEDLGHELVADDPVLAARVGDDRLVDLAEVFVGPDVALFASHYISKPPHSGRPVLWHQDAGYWPLDPMEVITLWLAVDPSTTANGCLRVVPGSHRHGVHAMRDRDDVASVFGNESAVAVEEPAPSTSSSNPVMSRSTTRTCSTPAGRTRRHASVRADDPVHPDVDADRHRQQPYPSAFHLRGPPASTCTSRGRPSTRPDTSRSRRDRTLRSP